MLNLLNHVGAVSNGEILTTAYLSFLLSLALIIFFAIFLARLRFLLFFVFVLVAWFPEFSQVEDAHTAEDIQTIYNFRPIPSVTASVFDYLFLAIVLIWVLKVVLPCPKRLVDAPLAKYMLALFAMWSINLVHGLWRGNEVYYALREFRCLAYFVLSFLMLVTVFKDYRDVRNFMKLTLVMALLVGGYGVVRYFLGIGFELDDYLIVYYDISDSVVLYFAILIAVSFLMAGQIHKTRGFLFVALMCPIVFTFLFSYRRGAWLGLAVGLLFLIFVYPSRRHLPRKKLLQVLVPVLAILLLIIVAPAGLNTVRTRVLSMFDVSQDSSNIFRLLDAANALNSFIHHPILGVGAGGRYDLEFTSEQVLMSFMEQVNRTSHNGYLYVLFKSGIIGLFIYLCVYFNFLRIWFQAKEKGSRSSLRAEFMACGAMVIAMLANNMTETVSDLLRPSLLLSFAMGWGAILIENLKRPAMHTSRLPMALPQKLLSQPALPEEPLGGTV